VSIAFHLDMSKPLAMEQLEAELKSLTTAPRLDQAAASRM
jgi:hypothetical protein